MFESLSDKLQNVFRRLSGRGKLTEADVTAALREVRVALLEADVNFRVVRDLIAGITQQAVGAEVLESLTPAQQVVKIVHEHLLAVLGETASPLQFSPQPPTVVLLCGLQGSGKTTSAAKLARWVKQKGRRPLLVACDVHRPAAVKQLQVLGAQIDTPVYAEEGVKDALGIARRSLKHASDIGCDVVILDTAGRLHVDEEMMAEVTQIRQAVNPNDVLLVLDAMTGQDAVRVAEEFHAALDVTGFVLTKLDGDTRGGAAISIRSVVGKPIRFIGEGEKLDALEVFHPDRMASRILGMGDVLTLIERAQTAWDANQAEQLAEKLRKNQFDLNDFLTQMRQIQKMGSLDSLIRMIPGMSRAMGDATIDPSQLKRVEAIILSMTRDERSDPSIINGSRRRRIAAGSGTTVQEVNELLHRYAEMRKMMKGFGQWEAQAKKGRKPKLPFMR